MYKFFITPGHGYLQVPHKEIVELGIYDKISKYSYRKFENKVWYALLEEDCDATVFLEAWEAKNKTNFDEKQYQLIYVENVYSLAKIPDWPRNLDPYK